MKRPLDMALSSMSTMFAVTPKTNTRAHFVRPELVAQVGFGEWTRDGLLRHPVFHGLRIDKDPKKVGRAP